MASIYSKNLNKAQIKLRLRSANLLFYRKILDISHEEWAGRMREFYVSVLRRISRFLPHHRVLFFFTANPFATLSFASGQVLSAVIFCSD
jgi:hypothetical protein